MSKDDEPKRTTVGTFKLADILNAKPRVGPEAANDPTSPAINFDMSSNDALLIARVVERIATIAKEFGFTPQHGYQFDAHFAAADIANVHCNGCRLRLLAWLMAGQVEFMEDYIGIQRHVNRITGGLNGEWRPAFAEPKQ